MKLKEIYASLLNENTNELYSKISSLRRELALAAQKVYSEWEQDEEGYDEVYGSGGICDDIADAMCGVVNDKTEYGCFTLYNEYDCHTSIYVYDIGSKKIYNVDIPPYVYEKGTAYTWKKIQDVTFDVNNIDISEVDWDMYLDEDGNLKDEWG